MRSDRPPLVRTTTCDYISANKFRSKIRVLDKRGQDIYHPNTNNTSDIFKNITSLSYFFTRIILADARFLGLQPAILEIFVHIFWSKTINLGQKWECRDQKIHLTPSGITFFSVFHQGHFKPMMNFLKTLVQNLSLKTHVF